MEQRKKSPIEKLRDWNGWIKRSLISDVASPGDFVLEIGGGKGGDLEKWHHADIAHLVLAGTVVFRVSPFR